MYHLKIPDISFLIRVNVSVNICSRSKHQNVEIQKNTLYPPQFSEQANTNRHILLERQETMYFRKIIQATQSADYTHCV